MMMNEILWEKMKTLFSVIMVLDRDLKIVRSSDVLQHHLPQVIASPLLTEVFDIKRPSVAVTSFEDLRKSTQSLFLMLAHDGSFAVRGQVVDFSEPEGEYFCFLGSPWLSWLHSNRPDLNVGLSDFTAQDAQMDQLFYISTEKRMVEDLEQLNLRLKSATEQLEVAQAAKNAFFAQISHEMRTPLNAVVSAITLLRDLGLTGQAAKLLDLAQDSSHNLMQVIDYVLDISRIENAEVQSEEVLFDMPKLIASVIDIVRARAIEKGLEIYSHIDGRLTPEYLGDVSLLRQSLLNIVVNAIKFTDQGEINVKVTPAKNDGMTLRIEVSDTGIGIAEQDQTEIFEPFRTVRDKNSIDRGPCSGLGLDIARRNVEFMGGKIGVTSAPGEGSTFWLEVHCPVVRSHDPTPSDQSAELLERPCFNGRVMLVDDNAAGLMLGRMILESMGLEVTPAASGEEAVALARDENLDMVLMDISMPGIDGLEATRQIRAFRDASVLPIVALTAFASYAERERSEACGMNGYLTKPIDRRQLADALSTWLASASRALPGTSNETACGSSTKVDHAVLGELARQIGAKNLSTVTDKFLNEIESRWQALESAGTKEELFREAHTLASTCRSFGLPSVADKLADIERHARFGGGVGEPPSIADTGRELKEGAKALRIAVVALGDQPRGLSTAW